MNDYYVIKCDKMFRKTTQRFSENRQLFTQERTFWSLVCEVLACHPEGLTKDEIIAKIGFCSSQSQVWTSLKQNGYVERIPKSWKMRLTSNGLEHLKKVFAENGFTLNTNIDVNPDHLFIEQFEQGKLKNAQKDF